MRGFAWSVAYTFWAITSERVGKQTAYESPLAGKAVDRGTGARSLHTNHDHANSEADFGARPDGREFGAEIVSWVKAG